MRNFGFQRHKQKVSRFWIPYYIKEQYNGQGKRRICFVACFTAHEANLSCNKSAYCRLRKVESSSTFCKRICTSCEFYRPKAKAFCSKKRNSHVKRDSPVIFFQSESNMHATWTNLICCETGLNVGGKIRNVFVVRFTVALSIHGANHSQKRNIMIKHFIIQLDLRLFPSPQRVNTCTCTCSL